jgi:hypothetical protein
MNMDGISLLQIIFGAMLVFVLVWSVAYEWRRRAEKPTGIEQSLARGWLLFRRIACFTVAAFFLLVGTRSLLNGFIAPSFFCLVVAGMAVWVGIYGGGRRRSITDDRRVHTERKRRYGWRW